MNRLQHAVYIYSMALIVVVVTAFLAYTGYSYYHLPLEERFYHPQYDWFKPSGIFGHGLGIIGTLLILVGVIFYMASKKYGFLTRFIRLKYLLEFHIFLCTLGPILVLFHTTFKFGGIVSIAFWSMVAVVLSGVIGRFIYIQIPRSIVGRELSLVEVQDQQSEVIDKLSSYQGIDREVIDALMSERDKRSWSMINWWGNFREMQRIKGLLQDQPIKTEDRKEILNMAKNGLKLSSRIRRLTQMQRLFKYWHVAHRPFALIMLVIVTIHVVVTVLFGYKWIF